MRVQRSFDIRMHETWEIDPAKLPNWDGEEDSLSSFDWEILKHGKQLDDGDLEPTDGDLDYLILDGWDESDRADSARWIDPDVMAS